MLFLVSLVRSLARLPACLPDSHQPASQSTSLLMILWSLLKLVITNRPADKRTDGGKTAETSYGNSTLLLRLHFRLLMVLLLLQRSSTSVSFKQNSKNLIHSSPTGISSSPSQNFRFGAWSDVCSFVCSLILSVHSFIHSFIYPSRPFRSFFRLCYN